MTRRLPQSTAYTVVFKVFLASDHVTPATGKTVAITLSKAGAAFGNPAAGASSATEIANGWYKFALGTGDTGTLGDLVLVGTATACDSADIVMMVVDATNGGASNLDAAVSSRLAPTVANRTLDVSANGEAGLDWANIGAPSSSVTFSGTVINVVDFVGRVNSFLADSINAAALAADAVTEIVDAIVNRTMGHGTVTSGATTNSVPTSTFSPAGAATDQFLGRALVFDLTTATAGLRGCARLITASSNAANPTFTVDSPLPATPASGDTFSVI